MTDTLETPVVSLNKSLLFEFTTCDGIGMCLALTVFVNSEFILNSQSCVLLALRESELRAFALCHSRRSCELAVGLGVPCFLRVSTGPNRPWFNYCSFHTESRIFLIHE